MLGNDGDLAKRRRTSDFRKHVLLLSRQRQSLRRWQLFGQQNAHSRVHALARVEVAVAEGDALLLLLRHTAGVAERSNIGM